MPFCSILYEDSKNNANNVVLQEPAFFHDLNLDQIIDTITHGREEYNLKPFFYSSLHEAEAIKYRHEIFRDLNNKLLSEQMMSFAEAMRIMRVNLSLAQKFSYRYQKERWFLAAVKVYCEAVNHLASTLTLIDLKSRGFLALREYLLKYTAATWFVSLFEETRKISTNLANIKYSLVIKGNCIKVRHYEDRSDYSIDVEKTFEKFKQGAVKDYRVKFSTGPDMNHVEAKILEFVAQLHPDIFKDLSNYCESNSGYLDETIAALDREIQFYLAYRDYVDRFNRAGLKFCFPHMSDESKEVHDYDGFDLALAHKLITENLTVVCNDFYLKDKERIFVVSGPNQGGKTTFSRVFGQLHYLGSIGCPVPGEKAQLFLFDQIFTHFEKEENATSLRGKLQDDLIRINSILTEATPESIIILNEIFTSTTLKDAIFLGGQILSKIIQLDCLCVCVTFLVELASIGEQTVSIVSTVALENPEVRTYRIVRKPADGLSYAISIAEKYRLTYDCLRGRLKP